MVYVVHRVKQDCSNQYKKGRQCYMFCVKKHDFSMYLYLPFVWWFVFLNMQQKYDTCDQIIPWYMLLKMTVFRPRDM